MRFLREKSKIFNFSCEKIRWSDLDQIRTIAVFYLYLGKCSRIFLKIENCHNGGHLKSKLAIIWTKMGKILRKNGHHYVNFKFFQKSFFISLDNAKIQLWSKFGQILPPNLLKTEILFFLSMKSYFKVQITIFPYKIFGLPLYKGSVFLIVS